MVNVFVREAVTQAASVFNSKEWGSGPHTRPRILLWEEWAKKYWAEGSSAEAAERAAGAALETTGMLPSDVSLAAEAAARAARLLAEGKESQAAVMAGIALKAVGAAMAHQLHGAY